MRNRLVSVLGLVALLATSASAGTLTTPYLFAGDTNGNHVCVATNVGGRPLKVTVEAIPSDQAPGDGDTETCILAPLAAATTVPSADGTCEAPLFSAGFCRFTVDGSTAFARKNVRGVMINRQITAPFTIFTTLQAE